MGSSLTWTMSSRSLGRQDKDEGENAGEGAEAGTGARAEVINQVYLINPDYFHQCHQSELYEINQS